MTGLRPGEVLGLLMDDLDFDPFAITTDRAMINVA
jgi:hypothetical protein